MWFSFVFRPTSISSFCFWLQTEFDIVAQSRRFTVLFCLNRLGANLSLGDQTADTFDFL